MAVEVFTLDEFRGYVVNLPKKLEFAAQEVGTEVAKSLQRRIRFRATGSLKNINVKTIIKKGETKSLVTGPAHWGYVDRGVFPKHPIPVQAIELNKSEPGITAGKELRPFISKEDITGWFQPGPSHMKGFVTNSLKTLDQDISSVVEKGLSKALNK